MVSFQGVDMFNIQCSFAGIGLKLEIENYVVMLCLFWLLLLPVSLFSLDLFSKIYFKPVISFPGAYPEQ